MSVSLLHFPAHGANFYNTRAFELVNMRPGQLTPNDFELAILQRLAVNVSDLARVIPALQVLSRQYTGVGCCTTFRVSEAIIHSTSPVVLNAAIVMPGLEHGLDALLFLKDGKVDFLEVVTFGGELWDGVFEGFSIPPAA